MNNSINDDGIRNKLSQMLAAGLRTDWEQRAYTSEQVNATVARLQHLNADDYEQKLVIAGFTDPMKNCRRVAKPACTTCSIAGTASCLN